VRLGILRRAAAEEADERQRRLLSIGSQRPGSSPADERDDLPPPHSSPRVNGQRYAVVGPASRTRRSLNAASTAASSASRMNDVQYGTRCRCPVCRTKRAAAAADRRLLAAVFSALCVTETKRSAQRWCEPTFLGSPLNAALLFRRPS